MHAEGEETRVTNEGLNNTAGRDRGRSVDVVVVLVISDEADKKVCACLFFGAKPFRNRVAACFAANAFRFRNGAE